MDNLLPLNEWISAARHPEHIVAFSDDKCWTQAMLVRDVHRLYGELNAYTGERWALCFDNSYGFIVALLATLHAGKTPLLPGHCRETQLREQQSLFSGVLTDLPSGLDLDCPVINPQTLSSQPPQALSPIAHDAGVILFTSGSTGEPSQVFKPLSALNEESAWLAKLWGHELQNCRVVASVSHQHMYGLTFRIMLPMALGLACDVSMIHFPEQLAALTSHPLLFISSPAFLKRLDTNLMAPPCRKTISAAGLLDDKTAQQAKRWFGEAVCEIYGTTETGVLAWRQHQSAAPLWQPFPDVEFVAREEKWSVRSPLIAEGGCSLDDNLAFTRQGGFRLLGRRDRIVKIEEKRVSLSEIERRLMTLPGVQDAAVVPIVRAGRMTPGAVVVLDGSVNLPAEYKKLWRDTLRQWLEPVAIPRYWRIVESIPLNSQSKRAWAQLQELFDETH
ncbi:AMP-binding protein [Enterobacteriaceae bacterium H20N1]|uniref:AMP-binding protein n=1 Tax=Dryocola boscaweniae TaxID=2925397 RepID=A0A9X2WC22_9ENTR|nr:AMP-binding protein [Dryocola boscaweniae]MCT4704278.1 AMP-binding protein [Dryocola boscaweniae]MCT4721446.1 AMP-binding protein [Dryocola boscaweniae]